MFIDPYEWLRDKSSPEVLAYLEAENDYADQTTAQLEPLRQRIFDEIKARTKETDLSVPVRRGDWWYYARSFEGKQYGVQCRCAVADPTDWNPPIFDEHTEIPGEQVLLDENVEAEGHDFFSLGAASVSPDGNVLAYSVDVVGDERYTLRFRNLRTGEQYPDEIVGIGAGATWATDNRTVYYVTARRGMASRHGVAASACFGPARREGVSRSRREVLARGRPDPQRRLRVDRVGIGDHLRGPLRRRRRPACRVRHRAAAPRRHRVFGGARDRRRAGPVLDPAQRRCGELHAGGGACRRPHRAAHPDRAPRRCATGRRRRVRRALGGQLPRRGAAANPVVAHRRSTTTDVPRRSRSTPS